MVWKKRFYKESDYPPKELNNVSEKFYAKIN